MGNAAVDKRAVQILLSLALLGLLSAMLIVFAPQKAFADELSDLQAEVERTAEDYNNAISRMEELNTEIEENQARLDEIEALLPDAQARSDESARMLYIFHRDNPSLANALLCAQDLGEFLDTFEYIDRVNSHNVSEIQRLGSLQEEAASCKASLEEEKLEVEAEIELAENAMAEAQDARQRAEEEAIAKAQAEAEAAAAAEFAAKEEEAKQNNDDSGVDAGNEEAEQPETEEVQEITETVSSDSVDWSDDKQAFLDEWTGRIDAYLAGSPMEGQGATFASAAWDSGVDPRWSPAISCVESTKGAYCFLPCNAWGWGDYSFGSWEEAIPGHVSYLGSMYGSTITPEAASIYCPPNASFWYNRCLEEMGKI